MKAPSIALTFCLVLLLYAFTAPDAAADHNAYDGGAGCSGDYGSGYAAASCGDYGGERIMRRGPVRRLLRLTARVATAPVRAVGRVRFAPQSRGYGRRCRSCN